MAWMRGLSIAAALAFLVDQGSKVFAPLLLPQWPAKLAILPVFNLVLVFNPGVTFGMLSGATVTRPWLLAAGSFVICGVLAWFAFKARTSAERWSFGAAIGGALGNVLGRVRQGTVTDFLDIHYGSLHWPAFNLADAAVVCGIGTYVAVGMSAPRRNRAKSGLTRHPDPGVFDVRTKQARMHRLDLRGRGWSKRRTVRRKNHDLLGHPDVTGLRARICHEVSWKP